MQNLHLKFISAVKTLPIQVIPSRSIREAPGNEGCLRDSRKIILHMFLSSTDVPKKSHTAMRDWSVAGKIGLFVEII